MELKDTRVAFHTLGCKVNIYETEVMEEKISAAGAEIVPFTDPADIYIVNTCTVTNMADRKSRQMLHRAKAVNPEAVIVACGCFAQVADPDELRETGVDLIIGADQKGEIAGILSDYLMKGLENVATDVSKPHAFQKMALHSMREHCRVDLKVQDGCNQFCTYCIIPYARGRIRSKLPEDVLSEVQALSAEGVQEFVLTGIHLSSYGKDLPEAADLLTLIRKVHEIDGVKRIRLGSLEPRIVTEEFAKALSELPKICPHFHLSLQSGCAGTLRRMNRHYSPEEYREGCEILRKYFDDPAITTDVICGFPGETEEEFEESLRFVRSIGFYELHVFKYSRRKGTVADRMPGQLTDKVKTERSARMIRLGEEMSEAYRRRQIGKNVEVLTEETVEYGGKTWQAGYTKTYVRALVPEDSGTNRIIPGLVTEFLDSETVFVRPTT